MTGAVEVVPWYFEQTKDGCIKANVQSRSIVIDENVISELFHISNVGKVEPPNAAFQIANNYMNNIASSGGYCSREGWVVSWMKKPYAQWYAAIPQVIYLWRRHTYFSNKTTVTLCRAEHKKPVNWCLIMLQCLGVELHRWDNNCGGDVFVAGPVVDILLRKRIPLEERPDNVTLEPVEKGEEKEVEAEMENSPETLRKLFMREKRPPPTINTSPLFSRRSQQLQSKNKSVRSRTTDASPVFVRRSPRFQSQSKPVSPSQEVADKELPGRNCPRTQSPSRRSPARRDQQLTPPMEQDVNMELEVQ